MAVYNAFGCCIGYILHHSGEITGCDEKFGCIKRNLPLRSAVLMNQLNEMFEYLLLAIHSFRLLLEEQMPGLVIEIQDKVLHEVFERASVHCHSRRACQAFYRTEFCHERPV